MTNLNERYPCEVPLREGSVTIERLLDPSAEEISEFVSRLPQHDLLFLSRDISEPKVLSAWRDSISRGDIVSVAARRDGVVLGTTAVVTDKHSWSPHVGELRILVAPEARATGLGRQLIQESFLLGLDLGLDKLTVRMTIDQDAALAVFEEMGFRTEAMFRDHVMDKAGNKHDLLILSHDVVAADAQMQAYGLDGIGEA